MAQSGQVQPLMPPIKAEHQSSSIKAEDSETEDLVPAPKKAAKIDVTKEVPMSKAEKTAYNNQLGSTFMNLPREIRDDIYEHLLAPDPFVVPGVYAYRGDTSITRACRACMYECYLVLYGKNLFEFNSHAMMLKFKYKGLDCQPSKPCIFGNDLLSGVHGRFSFLQQVAFYPVQDSSAYEDINRCWQILFWPYGPAMANIEDFTLDFRGPKGLGLERTGLQSNSLMMGNAYFDTDPRRYLTKLRTITIRNLIDEGVLASILRDRFEEAGVKIVEDSRYKPSWSEIYKPDQWPSLVAEDHTPILRHHSTLGDDVQGVSVTYQVKR